MTHTDAIRKIEEELEKYINHRWKTDRIYGYIKGLQTALDILKEKDEK